MLGSELKEIVNRIADEDVVVACAVTKDGPFGLAVLDSDKTIQDFYPIDDDVVKSHEKP